MDENSMNENTSEATNETSNKPASGFFASFAELYDEKKYPKKPTPTRVYVYCPLAALVVTILIRQIIAYFLENLGVIYAINSPGIVLSLFGLFLSFSGMFIAVCQCVIRYGSSKVAQILPKVILITVAVGLLVSYSFLACFSDYYPIGFLLLGLLIGTIARAGMK